MRRVIGSNYYVISLLGIMAIATVLGPASVNAAVEPNPPTGVTIVQGDTEAKISWTAAADDSGCPVTDYTVQVYNPADHTDQTESTTSNTSYTAVGLTAGTKYNVKVFTYSAHPCDEYSDAATATFTTNSADNAADPTRPNDEPQQAPRQPTSVTAAVTSGAAAISWTAPAGDPVHCDVLDYSVQVVNQTDGGAADKVVDYITGTSASVSGLVAGDSYTAYVWAYSGDCDVVGAGQVQQLLGLRP